MVGEALSSVLSPSPWSAKSPGWDPYYLTCPDGLLPMGMCPPLHQLRVLVGLPVTEPPPLPPRLRRDQAQLLSCLVSVTGPGKSLGHSQPIRALPWAFLPGAGEAEIFFLGV